MTNEIIFGDGSKGETCIYSSGCRFGFTIDVFVPSSHPQRQEGDDRGDRVRVGAGRGYASEHNAACAAKRAADAYNDRKHPGTKVCAP